MFIQIKEFGKIGKWTKEGNPNSVWAGYLINRITQTLATNSNFIILISVQPDGDYLF